MGRPEHSVWKYFIKYEGSDEKEEGGLRQKHNRSHKNAWCSYCITNAMNLLPESECDLSSLGFDSVSDGNYQIWQAGEYTRRLRVCMREKIIPLRGVIQDLEAHLAVCVYNPNTVESSSSATAQGASKSLVSRNATKNPVSGGQSQVQVSGNQKQMTFRLESSTRRQLSKEEYKEFQHDSLRFWIASGASFHAADHPEVKGFFGKWMGVPLPSRYILSGQLLNEETKLLNKVILSEING